MPNSDYGFLFHTLSLRFTPDARVAEKINLIHTRLKYQKFMFVMMEQKVFQSCTTPEQPSVLYTISSVESLPDLLLTADNSNRNSGSPPAGFPQIWLF